MSEQEEVPEPEDQLMDSPTSPDAKHAKTSFPLTINIDNQSVTSDLPSSLSSSVNSFVYQGLNQEALQKQLEELTAASCRAVIPDASGMINPEKIREQITAVKRQLDVFQQLMTDAKSELDMAKMEEESQDSAGIDDMCEPSPSSSHTDSESPGIGVFTTAPTRIAGRSTPKAATSRRITERTQERSRTPAHGPGVSGGSPAPTSSPVTTASTPGTGRSSAPSALGRSPAATISACT